MFLFVTRYLNPLKHIPGLAILFDSWLKVWGVITNTAMLDYIDEIEATVLQWENTNVSTHKYGGIQFNCNGREIGHIHSNGLLDMLLSRKIKQELLQEGYIADHHVFKNTGWVSFYLQTAGDKEYAIRLLKVAYNIQNAKALLPPGRK